MPNSETGRKAQETRYREECCTRSESYSPTVKRELKREVGLSTNSETGRKGGRTLLRQSSLLFS